MSTQFQKDNGSFRDTSGFIYIKDSALRGHVRPEGLPAFKALLATGLLESLKASLLSVPFYRLHAPGAEPGGLTVVPQPIPFHSYPYEWTFSTLKEAALVTLRVHQQALERGYALKDASAFNLQILDGRLVHIDPLSFEPWTQRPGWVGYRQFCRHFLAPLGLMAGKDPRLTKLLAFHPDGIPLDLVRRLLPWRASLRSGLFWHLHAPDWMRPSLRTRDLKGERSWLEGLLGTVESLTLGPPPGEGWGSYMEHCGYETSTFTEKERFVLTAVGLSAPRTVWDFGANTGHFSRLVAPMVDEVIALDADPWAAESNGRACRLEHIANVVPLVVDLTNPSPSLGWGGKERLSLVDRGPCSMGLALAIVHHLALGAGIPFPDQARFFAQVCEELVVEFPDRTDDRTQIMLNLRLDGAPWYTREVFEASFMAHFDLLGVEELAPRHRRIYHLRRKAPPLPNP
jgi:hypothetical protein